MSNMPGLDFQLGEDIDALRDAVYTFAQAEIAPRAAEADRTDQFPMDLWQKFGELGVLGMTVPEEYGGTSMGYLAHMIALEEISRASASISASASAMEGMCGGMSRPPRRARAGRASSAARAPPKRLIRLRKARGPTFSERIRRSQSRRCPGSR